MRRTSVIRWASCLILLQGISLTAFAQPSSRRPLITHAEPPLVQLLPVDIADPPTDAPTNQPPANQPPANQPPANQPPANQPAPDLSPVERAIEELPGTVGASSPEGMADGGAVGDSQVVPFPADLVERALLAANTELDRPYQAYPSLGSDRVPFALFELDTARPQNVLRLRFDAGYRVRHPNRSEYFGPRSLDKPLNYQDYRIYRETTTGRASAFLEYGLRSLHPIAASSEFETTAPTDMQVGAKAVLLDGPDFFWIPTPRNGLDEFHVSTIMRTHISLGPALERKGTSTGHVSLEPGLLANYQCSPLTQLHAQASLWIPLGADKEFSGEVLKWGLGLSHVNYSGPADFAWCDSVALISSVELVGWEFLSGAQGLATAMDPDIVDNRSVIVVQPGVRLALGERFDVGASLAKTITNSQINDGLVRFEMRWFW